MSLATAIIASAVVGAGATIYGSYQQKKAAEEAQEQQKALYAKQSALQQETNNLQQDYYNKQAEYQKQSQAAQSEYQKAALAQQESATKAQQEMSQKTYELQQEQLNSASSAAPTYQESVTSDVNQMTELEKKRRAALGYSKMNTTGGLLSAASTQKSQLLGA